MDKCNITDWRDQFSATVLPQRALEFIWKGIYCKTKQQPQLWITRIPLLRSPGVNFDPKTSEHIFVNSSVKVGDESKKTDVKHNITQGKSWSKRMALLRGRLIPSKLCACLVKPWPRKIVQWLRDDIPHQNELMFENYPNLPPSGKISLKFVWYCFFSKTLDLQKFATKPCELQRPLFGQYFWGKSMAI